MQAIREVSETTVERSSREVPVDLLHHEISTDTESGINLRVLTQENNTFEYVQGVRIPYHRVVCV